MSLILFYPNITFCLQVTKSSQRRSRKETHGSVLNKKSKCTTSESHALSAMPETATDFRSDEFQCLKRQGITVIRMPIIVDVIKCNQEMANNINKSSDMKYMYAVRHTLSIACLIKIIFACNTSRNNTQSHGL